jgi:hypothetical protein
MTVALLFAAPELLSKEVRMSSEKPGKGKGRTSRPGKQIGMTGCGTPDIMVKAAAIRHLGGVEGVLAVRVQPEKIVLFVRDEKVLDEVRKVAPDMKFMSRPIEYVVGGDIKNLRKPR